MTYTTTMANYPDGIAEAFYWVGKKRKIEFLEVKHVCISDYSTLNMEKAMKLIIVPLLPCHYAYQRWAHIT